MSTKAGAAAEPSEEGAMDMETLLAREMGSVGRHQVRVLVLCAFAAVLSALSTNEFVFTSSRINTRCLIPECESAGATEWWPPWLEVALPATSGGELDSCQRFANSSAGGGAGGGEDSCPAALFDQSSIVPCEEYVYETTNSAVYDLDLACDEWRRSLLGSARTMGALLALPAAGAVSDRWGRRTALAIVSFNTAWMGILRYWANTYVGFFISVLVESALGAGGILACGYVLLMEVVPARYRVAAGGMSNSCFALGQVILGLVAWAVPNWRTFTLVIYAPQLLTLSYFWIMPESIRWYLSKGRYKEAEDTLNQIAKINGKVLSEKSHLELKHAAEREKERLAQKNYQEEPWLVVLVFRHKPILLRCCVVPVWWITMTFIYYGLSINAVNISGDPYLNYVAVSAVEIPGFWIAMVLVDRVGRKPVLMVAYWLCALCQIAYIFIPLDIFSASLTVYLVSKCSIASVVTALYLYTSELFPTQYRHTLFAFSSMMGRVGSIVAPLTPALGATVWEQLPFALFAGLALVAGALVGLMPETRGCRLPDTMREAAHIGRKPPSSQHQHHHPYQTKLSTRL